MEAKRLEGKTIATDLQEKIGEKIETFAAARLPKLSLAAARNSASDI